MLQRRSLLSASLRMGAVGRLFSTMPELKLDANGKVALPAMEFDHAKGCAPVFSPRQMALHYGKHHKAYVDKFNAMNESYKGGMTVEDVMREAEGKGAAQKVLFNQIAQHFNHSFFWKCLKPEGSAMPKAVEEALVTSFGSVDEFKKKFQAQGVANFGSGWTWVVYNTQSKQLEIVNTSNAGCPATADGGNALRPIFTVDVWEHAYYKDFENARPDFLAEVWKIANWEFVGKCLAAAKK